MFGHQLLVVYLCVSECICLCDIARRLIMKLLQVYQVQ